MQEGQGWVCFGLGLFNLKVWGDLKERGGMKCCLEDGIVPEVPGVHFGAVTQGGHQGSSAEEWHRLDMTATRSDSLQLQQVQVGY